MKLEHWNALILLNMSGNMVFTQPPGREIALVFALLWFGLQAVLFARLTRRFLFQTLICIVTYLTLFVAQYLGLGNFQIETVAGFLGRLLIGIFYFQVTRNPIGSLRVVLAWAVLLSLVIFSVDLIFSDFRNLFLPIKELIGGEDRFNVGFHNFQELTETGLSRNSSFFWEPGALAGYCILLLTLGYLVRRGHEKIGWQEWVLIIGVISTFSTTGYVTLLILMLAYAKRLERNLDNSLRVLVRLLVASTILTIGLLIWQLDFVGEKIISMYDRAFAQDYNWQVTRFGAFIFDWEYISTRPLTGYGVNLDTQFMLHPHLDRFETGNGFTGYLRQFGLIGFTLFWLSFAINLMNLSGGRHYRVTLAIFICVLLTNTEFYFYYPLWQGLHVFGCNKRLGV